MNVSEAKEIIGDIILEINSEKRMRTDNWVVEQLESIHYNLN